eukprot:6725190-Ditylum_brightwellii.AAC.1
MGEDDEDDGENNVIDVSVDQLESDGADVAEDSLAVGLTEEDTDQLKQKEPAVVQLEHDFN